MTGLALIDYGAGNLHSVHNALKAAGATDIRVTADPAIVAKADRIVLPGVGAFAHCMEALSVIEGMTAAMERRVRFDGTPALSMEARAGWVGSAALCARLRPRRI
jgi:glutamine amidotransferase